MKTSTLLLAAVCVSTVSLNTASAGSAHIDLGSLHIVINGSGGHQPSYNPGYRPYTPPYFPPSPPPIYRPTPNPFPTPAPRPAPAPQPKPTPAPQAVIPANMQGNWVERFADGTVWYHRLDADGTHLTTTVPTNGKSATSTTRASFTDGKLTISNGTFFAGLDGDGNLDLAVPGGRRRIWARSGGGVAPAPAPQPARPDVRQTIAGTWYEQTTGRDGSPVLFRYDVNADGSYDMFMYPRTASGWDFANPIGHLADKASAEARQWTFDGANLILGPGQSFQEGPMQVTVNGSGVTLSSTRGERNWNRNP